VLDQQHDIDVTSPRVQLDALQIVYLVLANAWCTGVLENTDLRPLQAVVLSSVNSVLTQYS
jgi:hypothetical protein